MYCYSLFIFSSICIIPQFLEYHRKKKIKFLDHRNQPYTIISVRSLEWFVVLSCTSPLCQEEKFPINCNLTFQTIEMKTQWTNPIPQDLSEFQFPSARWWLVVVLLLTATGLDSNTSPTLVLCTAQSWVANVNNNNNYNNNNSWNNFSADINRIWPYRNVL